MFLGLFQYNEQYSFEEKATYASKFVFLSLL